MTIRFADHEFDGPYPAASWTAPRRGGIYALMVFDPAHKPLPYRVVYFGEAQDFSAPGLLRQHHRFPQWGLYIATHAMPGANDLTRLALQRYLIQYYRPECNQVFQRAGAR